MASKKPSEPTLQTRQQAIEKLIQCKMIRRGSTHKRARLKAAPPRDPTPTERKYYQQLAREYIRLCGTVTPDKMKRCVLILQRICDREWGYHIDNHHKDYILAEAYHIRHGEG